MEERNTSDMCALLISRIYKDKAQRQIESLFSCIAKYRACKTVLRKTCKA